MDHMTLEMVDPLSTLSAERSQTIKHGLVINGIKSAHILVCQSTRDYAGWITALKNTAVHFHEAEEGDGPTVDLHSSSHLDVSALGRDR
jgi:hypothetical protein